MDVLRLAALGVVFPALLRVEHAVAGAEDPGFLAGLDQAVAEDFFGRRGEVGDVLLEALLGGFAFGGGGIDLGVVEHVGRGSGAPHGAVAA